MIDVRAIAATRQRVPPTIPAGPHVWGLHRDRVGRIAPSCGSAHRWNSAANHADKVPTRMTTARIEGVSTMLGRSNQSRYQTRTLAKMVAVEANTTATRHAILYSAPSHARRPSRVRRVPSGTAIAIATAMKTGARKSWTQGIGTRARATPVPSGKGTHDRDRFVRHATAVAPTILSGGIRLTRRPKTS